MALEGQGQFSSDRAIALMLEQALNGLSSERANLPDAVHNFQTIGPSEDAETRLLTGRRLARYSRRFNIATPDYGTKVDAARELVRRLDASEKIEPSTEI